MLSNKTSEGLLCDYVTTLKLFENTELMAIFQIWI